MEKEINKLQSDNERLEEALRKAKEQLSELLKTIDGVSDLLEDKNEGHVTDDDVRNLLKKYSGL